MAPDHPTHRLVIGDKNLSSWSLRAWLLLRQFGLPFEEVLIHLDQPDTSRKILAYSPAARVPVLLAGDQAVWDTLAITEFIAEAHPELAVWPRDPVQRARARVVAAEMHAGFEALREGLPFNVQAPVRQPAHGADMAADIARICQIWRELRQERQGGAGRDADGGFLFGGFCAADAMYAPVAVRFRLHGVAVDDICQDYVDAVLQLPSLQSWLDDARREMPPS